MTVEPITKERHLFMESVGLEPTHDLRYLFFRGSKALPTELRLRLDRTQQKTTVFFQLFLFNNIDDTDYNRFGTISVLGLQAIV